MFTLIGLLQKNKKSAEFVTSHSVVKNIFWKHNKNLTQGA
jgi:hypothetical protein